MHWVSTPPLDEVEAITQPQSAQHEQQTEYGPFSRARHQRLRQKYWHASSSLYQQWPCLVMMSEHVCRLVLCPFQNLVNLMKHQAAVCGPQCWSMVEVLKNCEETKWEKQQNSIRIHKHSCCWILTYLLVKSVQLVKETLQNMNTVMCI